MTQTFSPQVLAALATVRTLIRAQAANAVLVECFNTLDNAGVFAALDKQVDYAAPEEILEIGCASVRASE